MMQLRVMVVDDHAPIRGALAALLASYNEFKVIGEAEDGEEALRLCPHIQPDVILMDIRMPQMDGITATRRLCRQYPQIRVLILTATTDEHLVLEALEAGATGYLLKHSGYDELADAIRSVYVGQIMLPAEAARALMASTTRRRTTLNHDLSKQNTLY
jgi:two-component system, NarL family, response regulator LiaR